MNLDFKLIKFTNHAEELLKGNLYLNSLEYYRGIEKVIAGEIVDRNTAINDYLEGSVASINKEDLEKLAWAIFIMLLEMHWLEMFICYPKEQSF